MEERLQKIMARAGIGSRRKCEEIIAQGRVTVNGQVATLGMKADPAKDRIEVDGQVIRPTESFVYIALYKPRFMLSDVNTRDRRPCVRDLVPIEGHLFPVGRLDFESEGLILLTNDGDLAHRLSHPRFGHEKEYHVLVAKRPDEKQLEAWRHGVVLEDGYRTQPAEVKIARLQGKGAWLKVVLREGRKRQIREMARLTGLPIVKLIRVRIGPLRLGRLKPREWRYLSEDEIRQLKRSTTKSSR